MEAIGSGLVILVDGRNIKDTNLTQVQMGRPVSINNLTVHVLSMYDTYDLNTHTMEIHDSQYSVPLVIPAEADDDNMPHENDVQE